MTTTAGEPVRPATATGPGRATADTPYPEVALLSNGSYGVLITAAGAGVSTWRDLDVTRWREDATRDCWGQFCYVRDLGDGTAWSVGHQPLCRAADEYDVAFHADRAEFRRRDGDDRDPPGRLRRAGPRRGSPPGHARQPRRPAPRVRPDQLRRGVPEPPPRRPGPPGLREAVPGDGVRPRSGCPAGPPPAAGRGPEAGLGRPRLGGGRPGAARGVRDRPRPVPGPRPDAGQSRGPGPRGPPVRDHRPGAGPGLQPAAAGPPGPGGDGQRRVRHGGGRDPGGGPRPGRALPRTRGR